MLSCVPMALSNVFKEKVLGGVDMDAMYLNGFVALYQFISCIPSAIPAAYAQGMPLVSMCSCLLCVGLVLVVCVCVCVCL